MSSTIKVRFLIDKEQKRVVFAEAGGDFVDVLFSFLTLPLGRIVRLLKEQSCLGSLDSLYGSVEQLGVTHLRTEACMEMLLDPRSAAGIQCEDLKIKNIHKVKPRNFYCCSQNDCLIQSICFYTYSSKCFCHRCGKLMDKCSVWGTQTLGEGGIFVDHKDNFMITDDLRVIPISLLKGLSLFKEMQIKQASMLEERVIDFGTEEALNLLGRALVSKNPLTLVCFPDTPVKVNDGFLLPIKETIYVYGVRKEIKLKLVLNKEDNNIVYAEVGEDLINQLFSFLTFPLGAVLQLVFDNLSLRGCIKNLYSSAKSMGLECFKSEICRNMLLNPKLPSFYGCNKNQVLQLEEITSHKIIVSKGCPKCYLDNGYKPCGSAPCQHRILQAEVIEWNSKSAKKIMANAGEAFVVSSSKYMISDDLHVSPLSIISAVGYGMNLSNSDTVVKEVSMDKGKAMPLLGVMLISKRVLSDVFSPEPPK